MTFRELLGENKIVPVATVSNEAEAVELTQALMKGGISVIEITLRTPAALAGIKAVKKEVPEAIVLAGTVMSIVDMENVYEAGADGAVSPAYSNTLVSKAKEMNLMYLPGVATPSEVLAGLENGLNEFKLFPAVAVGGLALLKSLSSPIPAAHFCPTGGLNIDNFCDFLALPNVMCVGGSWMLPANLIAEKKWDEITALAQLSVNKLN